MHSRSSAHARLRAPTWPSLCAVCQGWGQGRLCADCVAAHAAFRPRCRRCAIEVPPAATTCGACLTDPPPFERTLAAAAYDYPWDRVISTFKFHDGLDLAVALADLLVRAHEQCRDARDPLPVPALLLPIPLAPARLRERGYNQAWELARRLASRLGVRADAELLLRIKETPHQLDLPRAERAANMRGAFAIEPQRRHEVKDQCVTLVDDVMTSGATVAEAARTLLAAGAARVDAWVVARTPRPEDA